GALLIGVLCGLGARLFSVGINHLRSEQVVAVPWLTRLAVGGAMLALLAWVSVAAHDATLMLRPVYVPFALATHHELGVWLVVLLLLVRVAAVMATYGAGGVGGLFIPLVVTGALTGRVAASALGMDDIDLLVVVGMAAFLGAGYRTPLAGVVFVAETTGSPPSSV